jgi:hypothetical protein
MPSVFRFLIEVAMKTKLDATKQHAYYAISLFGIKLFGINEEGESIKQNMPLVISEAQTKQLDSLDSILMAIIEHRSSMMKFDYSLSTGVVLAKSDPKL